MHYAQIIAARTDQRAVSLGEAGPAAPLTVQEVLTHVMLIQHIMAAAMNEGEHYGRIPGCGDKPTLLKSGAEKLCLLFRLAPAYDVEERQHERGQREYRVTVTLTSIMTRVLIGQGVGSCSTMENKYCFRAGPAEVTERPVPRAYWDLREDDPAKAQELIGGKGFTVKKVDGQGWMVAKGGEKVENDNPADHYNTVLKMAKKRALVDAVLTTTAASDIFSQDLEDLSARLAILTIPTRSVPVTRPAAGNDAALDPVDFRQTPIHFGKNRGMTLADLSPQQVHWYEKEWMPKRAEQSRFTPDDLVLIQGLKAYRTWREAEKAQTPGRRPGEVAAA